MHTTIRLAGLILFVLFVWTGCEASVPPDTVAVAGDHSLQAEEMVEILQGRDASIPGTTDVVTAVANLWIDYTLLAEKTQEDPDFSSIDVPSILAPELEQEVILALRNQEIQVDTVFTEEELRAAFEREGGNIRIRARHILFTYPPQASQSQRDSVEALAADVRERALAGEDFSALAEEHSADTQSAAQGGDLGTFGRGDMVPSFEQAAYALDAGETSELVESPYGLHIIRVDERIVPPFEDSRNQFESQLKSRTVAVAESTFVAGIEDGAEVTVQGGAAEVARQLAVDPGTELDDEGQALVAYTGGELTAAEFRRFIRTRPPNERAQMEQGTDAQLETLLGNLTRRELLLREARDAGLEIDAVRMDSMVLRFRSTLDDLVGQLELREIEPADGESEDEALQRRVRSILDRILTGQINIVPLGAFGYALRDDVRAGIYDEGVQEAVAALAAEGGGPSNPDAPTGAPAAPGSRTPGPPGP